MSARRARARRRAARAPRPVPELHQDDGGPARVKLPGGREVTITAPPAAQASPGPAGVLEWLAAQPSEYQAYAADLARVGAEMSARLPVVLGMAGVSAAGRVDLAAPVVHRFAAMMAAGQIGTCRHVRRLAPKPVVWLAWAPAKVRCAECAALEYARVRDTKEDRRCDECGTIQPRITPHMVTLAPVSFGGVVVPVGLAFGLCGRCNAVMTSVVAAEGER